MSQENVEIVLRGVAAMNRGDPEAFNALCDARFEMQLVGAVGEPVSYVGQTACSSSSATWPRVGRLGI